MYGTKAVNAVGAVQKGNNADECKSMADGCNAEVPVHEGLRIDDEFCDRVDLLAITLMVVMIIVWVKPHLQMALTPTVLTVVLFIGCEIGKVCLGSFLVG